MLAPRKVALITGASRGIGRVAALRIAAQGVAVGVHYGSDAAAAQGVVAAVQEAGGAAFALRADLADPAAPAALMLALEAELDARFGDPGFDILVNNAAVAPWGAIDEVTPEDLDRVLQVNFKAPLFLIQRALPRLRDGGRIINVSSTAAKNGTPRLAAYAPSKAALECLTLVLARQLGPRNITVNSVRPGATATELNPRTRDAAGRAEAALSIALGRVGEPEDVADVIAFLASDAGRWITGQHIEASGGMRL